MKKLDIEVGKGVYRSVEYTWTEDEHKAIINMTYEGEQIEPIEFWPPLRIGNDERAEDLVHLMARWLYDDEKSQGRV